MQKNIRKCMFETNSSSMHVIVIDNKDREYKKQLHLPSDADNYLMVHLKSYGWGFEWLDYSNAKLCYLVTYALQPIQDTQETVNDNVQRIWNGDTSGLSDAYNDLIDVIDFIKEYDAEADHVDGIRLVFDDDDDSMPYVDHQSCNGSIGQMLSYGGQGMSMAEFVFNPSVRMRISNDNEEDYELEEALRNARYPHHYD